MKKIIVTALFVLLVSVLVLGGCARPAPSPSPTPSPSPSPAPSTEGVHLVIAMWEGTEGANSQPLRDLVAAWQNESKGRITAEINYGAVMGTPAEHYDLAASGIADVAFVMTSYTPGLFPMSDVAYLPISNFTHEQLSVAEHELYNRGFLDDDFADTHVLCFTCTGPYQLHLAKGKAVKTFDDIKNKKIRASGSIHTEVVKSLGGIPVGMPAPEVYTSLDKGVIDGAYIPWDFIKSFRTESVVGSLTEVSFGASMQLIVMNKDTYNKMPADLRDVIDEVSPQFTRYFGIEHDKLVDEAKELLKNAGGETYQFSSADMQKLSAAVAPIWDSWIQGDSVRKQMVDELGQILEDMGVKDPLLGYTP